MGAEAIDLRGATFDAPGDHSRFGVDASAVAGDQAEYPGIYPIVRTIHYEHKQHATEEVARGLADVIELPQPELVIEEAPQSASTEFDTQFVKGLLDKHNGSTPNIRVTQLLNYAWTARGANVSPVAPELHASLTDSIVDWLHAPTVRDGKHYGSNWQYVTEKLPKDRRLVDYLREDTALYDDSAFIHNAARVNKISWESPEGRAVEYSARLIVLDAMSALHNQTS